MVIFNRGGYSRIFHYLNLWIFALTMLSPTLAYYYDKPAIVRDLSALSARNFIIYILICTIISISSHLANRQCVLAGLESTYTGSNILLLLWMAGQDVPHPQSFAKGLFIAFPIGIFINLTISYVTYNIFIKFTNIYDSMVWIGGGPGLEAAEKMAGGRCEATDRWEGLMSRRTRLLHTFVATDDAGRGHTVQVIGTFVDLSDPEGRGEKMTARAFWTTDGRDLGRVDKGVYQDMVTGETLRSDDPSAP